MGRKAPKIVVGVAELLLLKQSGLTIAEICEKIGVTPWVWHKWVRVGGIKSTTPAAIVRAIREFQAVMANTGEPLDPDMLPTIRLAEPVVAKCVALTEKGSRCPYKALSPYELCGAHLRVVYKGGAVLTVAGEQIKAGGVDIHPGIKRRRCAALTQKGGRCRHNAGEYNVLCATHQRALDALGRLSLFIEGEITILLRGEDYTEEL